MAADSEHWYRGTEFENKPTDPVKKSWTLRKRVEAFSFAIVSIIGIAGVAAAIDGWDGKFDNIPDVAKLLGTDVESSKTTAAAGTTAPTETSGGSGADSADSAKDKPSGAKSATAAPTPANAEAPAGTKVVDGKPVPEAKLLAADADAPEGMKVVDGKAVPVEEAADVKPDEAVAQYELTDGDGITQGLEKLRNQLGDDAPQWLKDLDTKEKLAEWATKNKWYSPDQVKDSVIMHKGDVLSIDAQGNLSIHNANGSLEARTDVLGRAGPKALGTRDFSDTVPTRGAEGTPTAPTTPDTAAHEDAHATAVATKQSGVWFNNQWIPAEDTPVPTELPDAYRDRYEQYAASAVSDEGFVPTEAKFAAASDSMLDTYGSEEAMRNDAYDLGNYTANQIASSPPPPGMPPELQAKWMTMQDYLHSQFENIPRPFIGGENIANYLQRLGLIG